MAPQLFSNGYMSWQRSTCWAVTASSEGSVAPSSPAPLPVQMGICGEMEKSTRCEEIEGLSDQDTESLLCTAASLSIKVGMGRVKGREQRG